MILEITKAIYLYLLHIPTSKTNRPDLGGSPTLGSPGHWDSWTCCQRATGGWNHGGTMEEPLEMDTLPGIRMEFEDDFLLNFFLRGIATSKVASNRWPMTELRLSNSWEEKRTLVDQHLTTVCQWYWLYQLNPGEDQRILPPDCWLTQYGYTWVYYMDICGQLNVDIQ